MRSRITIDIDEANQPIIRLEVSEDHSDLRDKTIKRFIENLNHGNLLSITCDEETIDEETIDEKTVFLGDNYTRFSIVPIPDENWFWDKIAKENNLTHIVGNFFEDCNGEPFIKTRIGFQHEPSVDLAEARSYAELHPNGPPGFKLPTIEI